MKLWQAAFFSAVVVFLAILWSLNQATPGFADPDAYYHIKMAQLISQQGLVRDFVWLPYTTLAEHFTDQHLVLHILLIPFVRAPWLHPFIGAKIFVVLTALTTLVVIGWCLRQLGLRWWWLATIVLTITTTWTFRLQLIKATPMAVMLIFLAIVCLVRQRWWWLGVISWFYVWVHGGFTLLLLVAVVWLVSQFPFTPWRQWFRLLLPGGVIALGIALGLIINPYFPNNLWFYWDQLVQIGIINYQKIIGVGSEWYPYNIAQLLFGSSILVLSVIIGVVVALARRQRLRPLELFSLLLVIGSIALTMKSRRYVEYAAPALVLMAAVWWDEVKVAWQSVERWIMRPRRQQLTAVGAGFFLVVGLTPLILSDLARNRQELTTDEDPTLIAPAMQWVNQQAVVGDKVLHSDWDDFPLLFYYSDRVAYMAGLDPTFMYRADADRYWLWEKITTGKYQGNVDAALASLAVRFVLVTKDHQAMRKLIAQAPSVKLVYSDDQVDIFEVPVLYKTKERP